MEYIKCNEQKQFLIEWKRHIVEDGRHIKFVPSGTEIIEYITAHKDKLTEYLYAFANTIFIDSRNRHFAYAMENYKYKTLAKSNINNKKEILLLVNKIINELLSINVVYWDIHSSNFLVNGSSIIVIDLDDAKVGIDGTRLKNMRYNYLDLVIDLYLGDLLGTRVDYLSTLMEKINISHYFGQQVSEYINNINDLKGKQIEIDPTFILTEFEDVERINYLRRKIK